MSGVRARAEPATVPDNVHTLYLTFIIPPPQYFACTHRNLKARTGSKLLFDFISHNKMFVAVVIVFSVEDQTSE